MFCPKCGHQADAATFQIKVTREIEKEPNEMWNVTHIFEMRYRTCPVCSHRFLSGSKKLIRTHRKIKKPETLSPEFAEKAYLLLKKKRITLQDAQTVFHIAIPIHAENLLIDMAKCGLLEAVQYPGTPKRTPKLIFITTEQAPTLIRTSRGLLLPEEIITNKLNRTEKLIEETNSWTTIKDGRLEQIFKILNLQKNLIISGKVSDVQLKDKNGDVIASLVAHGEKYERIVEILVELGKLLNEKKISTTVELAKRMNIATKHISDYRKDIEKLLGYNIRYCGLLKVNIVKKTIGRLQIPDEYQDDIPEFESHFREFLVDRFIKHSGASKAYDNHILPIDSPFTKKLKSRKTFVEKLRVILERDIKRALKKNERDKALSYNRDLQELNTYGKPISRGLLLRTLDQLHYKDYLNLIKTNWFSFNLRTTISYDEFIEHLNNIRINRIDWAHVKEAENDIHSLNESLYLMRTAIGKMPSQ